MQLVKQRHWRLQFRRHCFSSLPVFFLKIWRAVLWGSCARAIFNQKAQCRILKPTASTSHNNCSTSRWKMFQTITLQNVINNNENYVRVCRLFGWSAYLLFLWWWLVIRTGILCKSFSFIFQMMQPCVERDFRRSPKSRRLCSYRSSSSPLQNFTRMKKIYSTDRDTTWNFEIYS